MTVKIENDVLEAVIAEQGAELISLRSKETNIEYIWQGNPEFWARHAPVLFPIVGRLKDDQYSYQGKTYKMPQHGFARDSIFTVIQHGEATVSFSLKSNIETKKVYPFDFEFVISYSLEGDQIIVSYQIENTGTKEMYFSVGGHPAFNIPLEPKRAFEDYYLSFSPQKSRTQLPLKGAYIDVTNKTLAQTNISINLNHDLFDNDALIYETKGANSFSIVSDESQHGIQLSYTDMPYVGIWSPTNKNAPFVCIEPWCGIADTFDSSGEITEKMGINQLEKGKLFETNYTITIK